MSSNNPPYSELVLSREQHDFLLRNCDVNIGYGLNALQEYQAGNLKRETAERIVKLMEEFKTIRELLKKARPDHEVL